MVTNCSNSAVVSGTGITTVYVGGIAAFYTAGTMTNCSNSGKVVRGGTATYVYVGGIVGAIISSVTVSNCYYLEETCEKGLGYGSGGVTEKNAKEYKSGEVANLLNQASGEEELWGQDFDKEYKSGEVANLLNQASGEEELWGQDFDKGYPVPLGSLSKEEREAYKIYSVTFTYKLPDGGEDEKEKIITLYGNSDTPLTAPEETAVEGYAVTWTPALPETFGDVKEGETSFEATFTKTYTLTITQPTEGGTISATVGETPVEDEVAEGATVILKATPAEGYEFVEWFVTKSDGDEGETVEVTDNAFTMPASDVTVTATFKAIEYTITISETTNGTVTADKEKANIGEEVTLTVTPDAGYELADLTVKSVEATITVTDNKFTMPAGDVVVTATFQAIDYTITISETTNGAVTADKEKANIGEEVTLTITPNAGYELADLTVKSGETTITVTDNKFTMPADNVTVTATFEKKPEPEPEPEPEPTPNYYNIQFENICEGVDASLSKGVVKEGNQVSVYVEVEEGYDAENLKVLFKRSLYGYWEEVEEGVQPGEYIIYNVYTDIYVKVEGVEKIEIEEEPTGMSDIEGTKVYTQNGSLYVYTSQPQEVMIITMNGTILKRERQEGLRFYPLPKGVYIICIGEERYKVRN